MDEHCDNANYAEPLLADFRSPMSNGWAASLADAVCPNTMRYGDARTPAQDEPEYNSRRNRPPAATGYAEDPAVGNGHLEPGMQVLTKPFAMEMLARRIKGIIAET